MRRFSEEEFKLAIRLATDARIALKSHRINRVEFRQRMNDARRVVHHPPMTDEHFYSLLDGIHD